MSLRPPLRVSIARHADKEQSLRQFLLRHLAGTEPGQLSDLQIVARSLDSPLIKAITSLGQDIAGAGLSVRLIEAHEQLVIGPETCWIGDCMRRDPAKCDAYESFIEGCGEAAGCAAVSFERLWLASQAVAVGAPRAAIAALAAPPPPRDGTGPTIGTRH